MMKTRVNCKKNNGFTLTELVVVMVLLGIVMVIAVSVTLMVNRSQNNYRVDYKSETEIVRLESAFKNWLLRYDSNACTLTVEEDSITVTRAGDTEEVYTMHFADGTLHAGEEAFTFTTISSVTFDYSGQAVCCTVALNGSENYAHRIVYTMRAATMSESSATLTGEESI